MFTFKFELKKQGEYYKLVKDKLKTQFYQNLHFYVLSFMPEKFRGRVVYLPVVCEPEKIYKKHKLEIDNLEKVWNKTKMEFIKKLKKYFPKLDSINIVVSPQLYGTIGSYRLYDDKIIIKPRYDRNLVGLQKLIITALTHYFIYGSNDNLENRLTTWEEKQNKSKEIEEKILPKNKSKSMVQILDTEYAGKLAEESVKYLEKLKVGSKQIITKPDNLTKNETEIFNLLLRNKNKLVSFDEIADWLWKDKTDEKYSEYAITKLIERLKKKLPKNLIHSQRGTGYILHV